MKAAERRIDAAKRRQREAEARLTRAYERKRAAIETTTRKQLPAVWAAERQVREARAAVAEAELAALGITPMKTVFQFRGQLYVARIKREGWREILPVGQRMRVMKGRAPMADLWSREWPLVQIVGELAE